VCVCVFEGNEPELCSALENGVEPGVRENSARAHWWQSNASHLHGKRAWGFFLEVPHFLLYQLVLATVMSLNKPTICVLGCGTMGVAIIRGTLDSIAGSDSPKSSASLESSASEDQDSLLRPAGFIACVNHEDSAAKLSKVLGDQVKVLHGAAGNVQGVKESNVVLLW